MSVPKHETFEQFVADANFLHEAGVDAWSEQMKIWTQQHENIKTGNNHKVVLKYEDYATKLESKLMERLTQQYMTYQLSKGIHSNPTLQNLYNKVQQTKSDKLKRWFLTISFDDKKINENKLDVLSKAMIKFQKKEWLDPDTSEFKWVIEQRNEPDELGQPGYSGFHIHCTYKTATCESTQKTSITRGVLASFFEGKRFVKLVKDNGKVNDNYMGVPKKEIHKLIKQVKDREIQKRCSGSEVVEFNDKDLERIKEYIELKKNGLQ